MEDWRTKAKELGIPLKHRTKIVVLADIAKKTQVETKKTTINISRNEAADICCKAFREYAASKGLDPQQEILISRWYLQMNRNRMTFIGVSNDTDKQESPEGGERTTKGDTVPPRRPRGRPRKNSESGQCH